MRIAILLLMSAIASAAGPERFGLDMPGRLDSLHDNGEELLIAARSPQALKVEYSESGRIVRIAATTEKNSALPGASFRLSLPAASFAGGEAQLGPASAALGPNRPAAKALLSGRSGSLTLRAPANRRSLSLTLDTPRSLALIDEFRADGRFFTIDIDLGQGPFTAALEFTASPDSAPARLSFDPSRPLASFHGFGGNFCFGIEHPSAEYNLNHLPSAWARTEMTLTAWEPRNDNDSPDSPDWDFYAAQDKPGSDLRREFEFARLIQNKGLPYVASIWWLPEWMLSDPHAVVESTHRRRVPPEKWNEFLESVGSYLLYAKKQYGVEPDLFSFNEANIGVYVLFTPEEHRDAIKSIGAHFRKLSLKTRLLLADATGPAGTHTFAIPAANDPEALQYVGAVGFHSWYGATAAQYKAWGDLAQWLNLPLLVAEMGLDPFAHQKDRYDSYQYGLRELRMVQELLMHARPQSLLYWEYTDDYGLLRSGPDGTLIPTPRWFLIKQLSDLTPRHSTQLHAVSDHSDVLITAFRGADLTLHVANLTAAREITLSGIPADTHVLRAFVTGENDRMKQTSEVRPVNGTITLRAPARSLISLTTATTK